MSLETKINLALVAITVSILSVAFGFIVKIESDTIKQQTLNDASTSTQLLRENMELMFHQLGKQEERLQEAVDELGKVKGVSYINVTDVEGNYVATTDHALIGTAAHADDLAAIQKIVAERKITDVINDEGTFYELERFIPIALKEASGDAKIINVIEVEVVTQTKSDTELKSAQSLLQIISTNIEQDALSITTTRNENLKAIQSMTDGITKFGFFHDFIVFDKKLSIIANTGHEKTEFDTDPPEYRKIREDILAGRLNEATYERVHEGYDVISYVTPIKLTSGDVVDRAGVVEIHILVSAYKDKANALILRMLGVGFAVTAAIVVALAFILRRTVILPIARYAQAAQKISDGDLSQKVDYASHDEIGQFGDVFNSMVANLRELDHLKSDFISVAAHQLRTPLSGVKWVLKLLLDGDLGAVNEDQKGMLKRGYETNEKMIQLVNDLLNVSRIENGKFGYKFEKNDFVKLVRTLIENADLPARARNIEVRLDNHVGDILEFFFDPEKLLIALQNLVDNAVKYTLPGGRVTLAVERKGDYVQVKVSDTGVGIPKADLPKLFSKFFRAANVIHLQTDGSGLGLFIVKNIIQQHGGQIWVDSEEGKGTTFTAVIPVLAELLPKQCEGETTALGTCKTDAENEATKIS